MFQDWGPGDFLSATQIVIAVINILITAFVAIWVVENVQKKLNDESALKEYFLKELLQLRTDIRKFFDDILANKIDAQTIKREHHVLCMRSIDLLNTMNTKYGIDKNSLSVFGFSLMKIIESDKNYEESFFSKQELPLKQTTVAKLHKIRTENDHLFNDILLKLYENE